MFRCKVCGWTHEGSTPPDTCPRCGSPADRFRPVAGTDHVPTDSDGAAGGDPARLRLLAVVRSSIASPFARADGPSLDVATGDAAWYDDNIPCMRACPVQTDVAGYVGHAAAGALGLADLINRADNLFAGTLGRTCSRPCEDACRRVVEDAPIQIRALKRAAADSATAGPEAGRPVLPALPADARRVAVVGAGPAGLAAARTLREGGVAVTLVDRSPEPGGLMATGVPPWRLPAEVVADDVARALPPDVTFRGGTAIDDPAALSALAAAHDAVILATGTQRPRPWVVPGATGGTPSDVTGLVRDGLGWLGEVRAGTATVRGPVVVVGGGYTAADCARTARRLTRGAVTVLARRTTTEPALADEIAEARTEGVTWLEGATVTGLAVRDDVTHLRWVTREDERGTNVPEGRPAGEPPGSHADENEGVLPIGTLLVATGREPNLAPFGLATAMPDTAPGRAWVVDGTPVYLAGDLATGASTFIDAIADGRAVAQLVLATLVSESRAAAVPANLSPAWRPPDPATDLLDRRLAGDPYLTISPRAAGTLAMADRGLGGGGGSTELDLGLAPLDVIPEASRCLQCQANIMVDGDRCILCNGCVDVCPHDCISLVTVDRLATVDGAAPVALPSHETAAALVLDETSCIRCGKCVDWCPTACITMPSHRSMVAGQPEADLRALLLAGTGPGRPA